MSIPYWRIGKGRVRSEEETSERRHAILPMWWRCDYIEPDSIAAVYLRRRGIGYLADKKFRDVIRWQPDAYHRNGTRHPAIFALVSNDAGRPRMASTPMRRTLA